MSEVEVIDLLLSIQADVLALRREVAELRRGATAWPPVGKDPVALREAAPARGAWSEPELIKLGDMIEILAASGHYGPATTGTTTVARKGGPNTAADPPKTDPEVDLPNVADPDRADPDARTDGDPTGDPANFDVGKGDDWFKDKRNTADRKADVKKVPPDTKIIPPDVRDDNNNVEPRPDAEKDGSPGDIG